MAALNVRSEKDMMRCLGTPRPLLKAFVSPGGVVLISKLPCALRRAHVPELLPWIEAGRILIATAIMGDVTI